MTQQPAAGPFPPSPSSPVPGTAAGSPPLPVSGAVPSPTAGSVPPPLPGPVPPPPPAGRWQPERVDPVPGTDFGLLHLRVMPITSGLAIGSLVAGIGAILVSFLVFCFGLAGAEADWGGWVSGAFALLAVVIGGGATAVGLTARRQIRRAGQPGHVRFVGGGLAIAGISCGLTGAGIALLALTLALLLQV